MLAKNFHTLNHKDKYYWQNWAAFKKKQFTDCLLANCFKCQRLSRVVLNCQTPTNNPILFRVCRALIDPTLIKAVKILRTRKENDILKGLERCLGNHFLIKFTMCQVYSKISAFSRSHFPAFCGGLPKTMEINLVKINDVKITIFVNLSVPETNFRW